jgi:hypothetical protein
LHLPTQRFGETRSGKSICTYFAEDEASIACEIATFTVADSFDAYAVFQHLLRREIRRSAPSADFLARFERHLLIHLRRLKRGEVVQEMQALSLITIVNVAEHGKSRADHIFLD